MEASRRRVTSVAEKVGPHFLVRRSLGEGGWLSRLDHRQLDVIQKMKSNPALRDWRGQFMPEFVAIWELAPVAQVLLNRRHEPLNEYALGPYCFRPHQHSRAQR